jgi:hypothetical protein
MTRISAVPLAGHRTVAAVTAMSSTIATTFGMDLAGSGVGLA